MALYTKKLIMSTFQEMLEELPFDKITVTALVKRAGISPNTFYYHYQDIYALLGAWFRERAESFIPSNAPIWGFQSSMKPLQNRIPEGLGFCQTGKDRYWSGEETK